MKMSGSVPVHTDTWARYRQLAIRQPRNAAIYSKFKHASQMPDCDQDITSVPIGKLQLLDKFSKWDIQLNLDTKNGVPVRSTDQISGLFAQQKHSDSVRKFGYMRAETLLKF